MDFERGFFTLNEDYERIQARGSGGNPRWIMAQQVNIGASVSENLSGYQLTENRFSPYRPSFLGFPLANSPRGYNYAIYRRDD